MEFDLLILLIWGFVFGFTLAFGIGANDVANAFGTTIGSGAISIRNAFILASICEIVGAVLLGGGVATELSKGVINISLFIEPDVLSLGYLSVLIACTIWLITASAMRLPVSATQSAVGGMIGMSAVMYGFDSIGWHEIGRICLSWIISPLLSGAISAVIYTLMKTVIFKHKTAEIQMRNACYLLPFLYFITFGVNTFGCLIGRPQFVPNVEPWPRWIPVVSSVAVGFLVSVPVTMFYIPRLKTSINTEILPADFELTTYKDIEGSQKVEKSEQHGCCTSLRKIIKAQEIEEIGPIFFILQISTSCFGAIAHGGNDVANAIAPVTAMYEIYETKDIPQEGVPTATWILLFGGLGITAGLWAMGKRVVKTLGSDLAAITPPKVSQISNTK